MLKLKNVDLEDSNIANYGSDVHKNVRKDAAESEKEWEGAGAEPGVEVWRIENFGVKRWKDQGTFYQGDSYIVLHTYKTAESKKLLYNVFFWLGKDTTQDEYGTAAYKTVELDDLLDDVPVQYREVQGSESQAFRKLFPRMTLLDGGVDSAFEHVKPTEYKPRLLHVKGKNNVVVQQVPLSAKSLNDGDCFILDAGLMVWQWNGSSSNHFERRKAMETVNSIKDQRNGKPESAVLDSLEDSAEFWKHFGGKPSSIAAATPDVDVPPRPKKLFRLSDASGKLKFKMEAKGSELKRSLLDSKDVFIVDSGIAVYVWVGKDASKQERANATGYGQRYLIEEDRTACQLVRVVEGGETKSFNDVFVGPLPEDSKSASGPAGKSVSEEKKENSSKAKSCGLTGVLRINIKEAKGLRNTQSVGTQDPYAIARIGNYKCRSEVQDNGGDAAGWEYKCKLAFQPEDTVLEIVVKNDNLIFDAAIGRAKIDLVKLAGSGNSPKTTDAWYALEHNGAAAGEVNLVVEFVPPMRVCLKGCRQLRDVQTLGKQDPFAKVEFGDFRGQTEVHQDGNKDPVWSKTNVFPLNICLYDIKDGFEADRDLRMAADPVFEVHVLNHNLIKNDLIGHGHIQVKQLLELPKNGESEYPLDDGKDGVAGKLVVSILE